MSGICKKSGVLESHLERFKTQIWMRLHIAVSVCALCAAILADCDLRAIFGVIVCIIFVSGAELSETAVECTTRKILAIKDEKPQKQDGKQTDKQDESAHNAAKKLRNMMKMCVFILRIIFAAALVIIFTREDRLICLWDKINLNALTVVISVIVLLLMIIFVFGRKKNDK